MEAFHATLLAVAAFWLGACPFSVWVGRWLLDKDIREYGDGNPGAVNVFRAGSPKAGFLAVILDIGKGIPFVFLAHSFFRLSDMLVMAVGLSAILGHAFSPLLRLRGGKALAVTGGVMLALPQHEIVIAFIGFMFLGFLILKNDAWIAMLGATGTLAYLAASRASPAELLFMLCVLVILGVKHFAELRVVPRLEVRLIKWLQSRKRET